MFKKILRAVSHFLLETIEFQLWIIPLSFFGYLVLTYIVLFILRDWLPQLEKTNLFTLPNYTLGLIISSLFFISFIGCLLRIMRKKQQFNFRIQKDEIIIFLSVALFFALFFTKSFLPSLSFTLTLIFVMLLTLILFILLPILIQFYSFIDLAYFKKVIFVQIPTLLSVSIPINLGSLRRVLTYRSILKQVIGYFLIIVFVVLTLVFFSVIIFFVDFKIFEYVRKQKYLRENLVITKVTPPKAAGGNQVTLLGYNFGWRKDLYSALKSDLGESREVLLWTDNKIIFILPLLDEAEMASSINLWIERITLDDSLRKKKIESPKISLKLVSRWYFYPKQNELLSPLKYFYLSLKKIRRVLLLKEDLLD